MPDLVGLSRESFNSNDIAGNHGDDTGFFQEMTKSSFAEFLRSMMTDYGVNPETYDKVVALGKSGLTTLTERGPLEAISTSAATWVGGPWGVALGGAIEIAGNVYKSTVGQVTIGAPTGSYIFNQGEWVAIDNGNHGPINNDDDNYKGELRRRRLAAPRDISVGFYIGDGAETNMVTVFNFKNMREEDHHSFDIRQLSSEESSKMDTNPLSSAIRNKRFSSLGSTVTGSKVPTDPGTEVIFRNELYFIVKTVGTQVVIEDTHGHRKFVSLNDLTRGRVTSTTSYNYANDGTITNNSFVSPGEHSISAGMFVWVQSRDMIRDTSTRELICVSQIRGDLVVGYYCLDGAECRRPEDEVTLLDDDFNVTLSKIDCFGKFAVAALAGYDTLRLAPGKIQPLICVGVVLTGEATSKNRDIMLSEEGYVPGVHKSHDLMMFQDSSDARAHDRRVEIDRLTQGATAQYDMMDTGSYSTSTNTSMLPLIAVVGLAVLLFNGIGI